MSLVKFSCRAVDSISAFDRTTGGHSPSFVRTRSTGYSLGGLQRSSIEPTVVEIAVVFGKVPLRINPAFERFKPESLIVLRSTEPRKPATNVVRSEFDRDRPRPGEREDEPRTAEVP
jgi:hypothetical protein